MPSRRSEIRATSASRVGQLLFLPPAPIRPTCERVWAVTFRPLQDLHLEALQLSREWEE